MVWCAGAVKTVAGAVVRGGVVCGCCECTVCVGAPRGATKRFVCPQAHQGSTDCCVSRAFHLWEAHTSLMLDARKSLENDISDDMKTVLMMQRDDTIDLTSTVDPKLLSQKIVKQVCQPSRVRGYCAHEG